MKQMLALLMAGVLLVLTACGQVDTESSHDAGNLGGPVTVQPDKTEPEPSQTDSGHAAEEQPDDETEWPDESVTVSVYSGNDNADGLVTTQTALDSLSPDALIAALIEAKSVPEQTKCLSFAQSDDGRTLTLDLSRPFADGIVQLGTAGESIMLASLVNTFLAAYCAEELVLTVEGGLLETGHNIYDFPLVFSEHGEDQ